MAPTPTTPKRCCRTPMSRSIAQGRRRGAYRFFTAAMDNEVQSRVTLGAELRERHRRRRTVPDVSAAGGDRRWPHQRRRGAAALAASRARGLEPRSVHPDRRAARHHGPPRRWALRGGVPAGPALARRRPRSGSDRRQCLSFAVQGADCAGSRCRPPRCRRPDCRRICSNSSLPKPC